MDYTEQIKKIKQKLELAKEADRNLIVFGASNHKYFLGKPASKDEVESFEQQYAIQLPECYKSFVLNVGNGGKSYAGSGAGPFYGIYPLGSNVDELADMDAENYLRWECLIRPNMSDEDWIEINKHLDDDDISNEDYDKELGRVFGGILPIGSQGCSYLHGLILNGENKGRIVNLDLSRYKPRFTFEINFLDWYERWLDEVISGELMEKSAAWFGYEMGGAESYLIELFQLSKDDHIKKDALGGLLNKKKISKRTLTIIENEYLKKQEEYNTLLLQILTKFDYIRAKQHLERETNLLAVFQFLFWYAKKKSTEWENFIHLNINRINDSETLRFCTYLLEEIQSDFGHLLIPFTSHENDAVRSTAFYSLGKSKDRIQYLDAFIKGLNDSSNKVIHTTLQALSGLIDHKLLPHYKNIALRFPVEEDYILANLDHRLAEYRLSNIEIKKIDLDSFIKKRNKKWYQRWK